MTDPNAFPIDLQSFFSPGGSLSRLIPGYQERPEQAQMALIISQALTQQKHCLVEAGTGVGKSLSYLVPGIAWALDQGQRLVVSTQTKALQSQLIEFELPRLAGLKNVFSREFRYELCVGMENYICLLRLIRASQDHLVPQLDREYVESLRGLMAWCQEPVSGLLQDTPVSVPDHLRQQVHVVKELCLGRNCQFFQDCFLTLAKQRQRDADILVTNHSLFFSNLAAEGRLLPEFQAAILDEAHKVEDVAASFLGEEIGQYELHQFLTEIGQKGRGYFHQIHGISPQAMERMASDARGLLAKQDRWWRSLMALFPAAADTLRLRPTEPNVPLPESEGFRNLGEDMLSFVSSAETEEDAKIIHMLSGRLLETAERLDHWCHRLSPETVYWAEMSNSRQGLQARLYATPLDISRKFRKTVLETIPTVIMCSATMAVNQSFAYLRSRLGISEALELVLASPFSYRTNAGLYLPFKVPDPKDAEAYESRVLQEIKELIAIFNGGLFVLFTSHRLMRRLAADLRPWAGDREILVQGEEAPRKLLKRFKSQQHAVLLGVETFWQGVDVPGDALRCVVITRLPFDVPTHPVHQARGEYLEAQSYNPFAMYSLPRAVLMLRQGFGRLIRRHPDRGVVAILDPRLHTRTWGSRFLKALPDCQHMKKLDEVREFVTRQFPDVQQGQGNSESREA